jgi:hypothetical protein
MLPKNQEIKEVMHFLGTAVCEFTVSNKLIENLNNLIDTKLNENCLVNYGYELAGRIENEFDILKHLDHSMLEEFNIYINHYLQKTEEINKIKNYVLLSCWFNDQKENEYNPLHVHFGHSYAGISSVLFLKIPNAIYQAKGKNNNEEPKDGRLEFVSGNQSYCGRYNKIVHPQIGKLYLFPYYLHHTVYPFKGEGIRRSLSFNIDLIK